MEDLRIAILHYSAPPVVGGVESVIYAQSAGFRQVGLSATVVSGRGEESALPEGVPHVLIPEMDTRHPRVVFIGRELEEGRVPDEFEGFVSTLLEKLKRALSKTGLIIVHNIFTKHFNLALSVALARYLEERRSLRCVAWCHDLTWTSPHSRSRVHEGYPWDLLRNRLERVTYVTISQRRRSELAGLLGCPEEDVRVVYNGVDPSVLYGLSPEGRGLVERLGLLDCDLSLLMPVRVTQAKNIEYAIRLARALKERGSRPRVVLTGPPDPHDTESMHYFESLRTLRRQLDVEDEMRFVYESGPDPAQPHLVGMEVVAELLRVCDLLFMPSHREGFGMPILEAGLLGMPIVCTSIPAAQEIGGDRLLIFDPALEPGALADRILDFVRSNPALGFRSEVRRTYTWGAIFRREMESLIPSSPGKTGEL